MRGADIGCGMPSSVSERAKRCICRVSSTSRPRLHLAHLVDRIAELEAAILGVHARLRVGQIAAVDVDDARHVPGRAAGRRRAPAS